jgi:excisionase family DNA binding protein
MENRKIEIDGVRYYTLQEAANMLGIQKQTLYMQLNKLETTKLGHTILILESSLMVFKKFRDFFRLKKTIDKEVGNPFIDLDN